MLNFELSVQEANVVLAALAAQPYNQVAALINKLQEQASEQIKDNPEIMKSVETVEEPAE